MSRNPLRSRNRVFPGRECAIVCYGLLSLSPLSALCAADAYEVSGHINFRHYEDDAPKRYAFTVTVDGCRWRIRDTNQVVEVFDFQEVCWDGMQLYHMVSQRTQIERANRTRNPNVPELTNVGMGLISENQILHDLASHEIGPLWLAFASGCYLSARVSGDLLEPVVCFGLGVGGNHSFRRHPFKQTAYWRLSKLPPFLPEEVVFIDDGLLRHPGKAVTIGKRDHPYDKGFTNVIYSVLETTNCGGLVLPANSILRIQSVNRSNELAVLAEYRFILDSCRSIQANEVFVPSMSGRTLVTESRYPELGLWTYEVTNNTWPSKALVERSKGYQEQLSYVRSQSTSAHTGGGGLSGRRLTVLAMLCVLGVSPFIFVLFLRKHEKRSAPGH